MPQPHAILHANLAQLRKAEPGLADRLLATLPADLQWSSSKTGLPTASIEHQGKPLPLASRYDPVKEAEQLCQQIDLQKHAGLVMQGIGLGYHILHSASLINDRMLMIVYEPDLPLLRAVLEKIDHTAWLGLPNLFLVDDTVDRGSLLSRIETYAATLAQGTLLVVHPPSRQRHRQAHQDFGQMMADLMAYCRTSVATYLVNASRTIYNLAMNLPQYAGGASTDDIHNIAKGYPAVCVGAGPSLAKNVDLLSDPKIRKNVIVITAQTTLKPLLDRGIRPDFVTALDYSLLSSRFYEGLEALPDVTMVAEPLAHPSILANFPGPIRCTKHVFLDRLLGDLATPAVSVASGATVAHLSFYVAQHLGCDPIILIGQDLGYSDGLYYCPGTAIHDVWATELGSFNSLEMMEWQRIVRMRGHLHDAVDIHGQNIYSDEQMQTYLKQFERDFAKAPQQVIDATEGGVPKENTVCSTLQTALEQYALRPVPRMPMPQTKLDVPRLQQVKQQLKKKYQEVQELRLLTEKSVPLLKKMLKDQRDTKRLNKLFSQLEPLKKRVEALKETFDLVEMVNTVGMFKRARADRAINNAGNSEFEEQKARLERDIVNVQWLVDACSETIDIFDQAMEHLDSTLAHHKTKP